MGAAWALQGQEAVVMLIGWCVRESANVVPYRETGHASVVMLP